MLSFKRTLATLSPPKLLNSLTKSSYTPASLRFESGEQFAAKSFGAAPKNITSGEVVFTTSLVGYPESMTDPSYHSQILVFTQPIIGNYGVPAFSKDRFGLFHHFESGKIQVAGIVVNDYCAKYSHWNAIESLGDWCTRSGVPALSGVDTRAIVTLLRDSGSKSGHISIGEQAIDSPMPNYSNTSDSWISNVSSKEIKVYNHEGDVKIALVDCGAKQNIIRCLVEKGAQVTVFPHDFDFSSGLAEYDGVFLSNGPGDPESAIKTIPIVQYASFLFYRNILSKSSSFAVPVPVFGICMGHQLMGLAAGFKTYKLPYGNRGHNQPCLDLLNGGCVITSQNHGYALDDSTLPRGWIPYFRNANDGSNEGIKHVSLPFTSVQFHPEAMGGPLDTQYLFTEFLMQVRSFKQRKAAKYTGRAHTIESALQN